jgi:3-deoxy-D-manno-octulosonic-acid transferase
MLANLIYMVALIAVSPLVAYRMFRHGRYRRGLAQKLWGLSAQSGRRLRRDRDCIWMHAVSVGEVNLLSGVVDRIRSVAPQLSIVISSSTDTGYDLAVAKFGAEQVFFCPLDFSWAVRRTLRNLQPTQIVLVELELWPNLIHAARRRSIPVRVINGRLSERSASRYIRFAKVTRSTFASLSWVGCQDDESRTRFVRCGVPAAAAQVTGSIKFDDAPSSRDTTAVQRRAAWAGVDPWHRVWVVGSTQPGEESMTIDIYNHLRGEFPELRLILSPRHRERFDEVARLIAAAGLRVHRRSTDGSMFDAGWTNDTVILVDTIGELRDWWGVGQIATVGGSFGSRGGQNMLEPAGYGAAVSFGPDTRNFVQIASELLAHGGAVRVCNAGELAQFVRRCLSDIPAADALGRSARAVIAEHRGASDRTVSALLTSDPRSTTPGISHRAA